jgi:hypothetical protein
MAKIKLGVAVAEISGKIGGTVFSHNSDGAHARSHTNQCRPRNVKQRAVSSKFMQATQAWRSVTDANRKTWYALAISLGKRSLAFRLYLHYYLEALHGGLTLPTAAPAHGSGFKVSSPSFTISRTPDKLSFLYSGIISAGQAVMIYATPPQSLGIDFSLKGERLIKICDATDTSPMDITSDYATEFGACFPSGSQICIRAHSIPTEPGYKIHVGSKVSNMAPDGGNETATKLK